MQGEEARRPAYRRDRWRGSLPPAVGVFAIALTLALVLVAGALAARSAGAPGPEAWQAASSPATRIITHTPLPSPTFTLTATRARTPATATPTIGPPTAAVTAAPTLATGMPATRTPGWTASPAPGIGAIGPTAAQTLTPTVSPTPTSAFPLVRVRTTGLNANLRAGPGLDYPVIATAPDGEQLLVLARAGDWFRAETPERVAVWVWSGLVEVAGDLASVPVLAIPTAGAPPQ